MICVSVVSAREGAVYMHAVAIMAVKETKEVARFVVTISERGRWGRGGRPGALAQLPIRTQAGGQQPMLSLTRNNSARSQSAHSDACTRQHLGSIVEMRVCLLFRGIDGSERPQRRQSWVDCAGHKVEEVS